MNSENPIVRRLDHIIFTTDAPEGLFSLFADTFQLPVVWDVAAHDFFTSGGVFVGNVYFEMMRFGRAKRSSSAKSAGAKIFGIAFEPHRMRESLDELRKRNVPHSPPFYTIGRRIDGKHGKAFTNVTLGKLLSDRWNFYLGKWLSGNSPVNLALGDLTSKILTYSWAGELVSRAIDDTMIYISEYTHDNDALRLSKSDELRSRQGGTLGVECVKEIILGVKDLEKKRSGWQNFLDPFHPSAPATWQLPEGSPSIRLVPFQRNVIKTLVLKVSSLERAKDFLAERGLLDASKKQQVRIEPNKIQGLDIRLVE
jgi:hypothetical protein